VATTATRREAPYVAALNTKSTDFGGANTLLTISTPIQYAWGNPWRESRDIQVT